MLTYKKIRSLAVNAILLLAASVAYPQGFTELEFQSVTCVHVLAFNDKCDAVTIKGSLYQPDKPTDKVVVIVHGSQGVDQRHLNYARHLNGTGMAALVLDSWTPRGIGKAQLDFAANEMKGARAYNQALDALRAADALKNTPHGYKKVGHIGESIGGTAAIWLTKPYLYREYLRLFKTKAPILDANVALYAGCFERIFNDRFLPVPTFFLGAELDNDTPAVHCERFAEWMNGRGGIATVQTLKGQHHDFDAPYRLHTASRAQNPSDCASYIDGSVRIWDKTGEKFPLDPEGYKNFQRKCIRTAAEAPVTTGYLDSPTTGFREWGDFFMKTLADPGVSP